VAVDGDIVAKKSLMEGFPTPEAVVSAVRRRVVG